MSGTLSAPAAAERSEESRIPAPRASPAPTELGGAAEPRQRLAKWDRVVRSAMASAAVRGRGRSHGAAGPAGLRLDSDLRSHRAGEVRSTAKKELSLARKQCSKAMRVPHQPWMTESGRDDCQASGDREGPIGLKGPKRVEPSRAVEGLLLEDPALEPTLRAPRPITPHTAGF